MFVKLATALQAKWLNRRGSSSWRSGNKAVAGRIKHGSPAGLQMYMAAATLAVAAKKTRTNAATIVATPTPRATHPHDGN